MITSLTISFGSPSIPGAILALNLPPALFSSSRVKSFSRRTMKELLSCRRADFAIFHASCSRESPFERVNLRRAVRHSRRRTDNYSFHIESLVRLYPQRGIEWSSLGRLTIKVACNKGPPTSLSEAFLKEEDLGLEGIGEIVGREVRSCTHAHPPSPPKRTPRQWAAVGPSLPSLSRGRAIETELCTPQPRELCPKYWARTAPRSTIHYLGRARHSPASPPRGPWEAPLGDEALPVRCHTETISWTVFGQTAEDLQCSPGDSIHQFVLSLTQERARL